MVMLQHLRLTCDDKDTVVGERVKSEGDNALLAAVPVTVSMRTLSILSKSGVERCNRRTHAEMLPASSATESDVCSNPMAVRRVFKISMVVMLG